MSFTFIIKETGEEITLPTPDDKPCKIDELSKDDMDSTEEDKKWFEFQKNKKK